MAPCSHFIVPQDHGYSCVRQELTVRGVYVRKTRRGRSGLCAVTSGLGRFGGNVGVGTGGRMVVVEGPHRRPKPIAL